MVELCELCAQKPCVVFPLPLFLGVFCPCISLSVWLDMKLMEVLQEGEANPYLEDGDTARLGSWLVTKQGVKW